MAATIPLRHDPEGANTLPPNWALQRLSDRGIILQADNYGRGHLKNHPRRHPPLTILHSRMHHGFEGVPRRYAYVEVPGQVNGWEIEVYVWFGQAHPTRAQLVKADHEVRRLIFPR
jgi:hypothetical protein